MKERNHSIDILRGLSILIIIFIHIAPYYLKMPWVAWIWNWAQFVVAVILLCSVAVTRMPSGQFEWSSYLKYIAKRLKRLLIPYYIFFAVYTGITYAFQPSKVTWWYFFQNNTLTGGIDFQWLVLLFILLAIIAPLTDRLYQRHRRSFFGLIIASLCLSCLYQFNRPWWNINYRLWMIGSWLSVALIARWAIDLYARRKWVPLSGIVIGSFSVWLAILWTLTSSHLQIGTFYHKYPPDIFHVSYSIWTMVAVYICINQLARFSEKSSQLGTVVMQCIRWCSTYSYELYFTHIIVIMLMDWSFPRRNISLWTFSVLTYTGTILVVGVINLLRKSILRIRKK
ncbi:MAG: acyltransferase family protein [Candidatus Roizmanbacteria bacterium]